MAYESSLGLIALTRFGYGSRADGDAAVAAGDPRGFLVAELSQPGITLLSAPGLPTSAAAAQQFFADRERRLAERFQVGLEAHAAWPTQPATTVVPGAPLQTVQMSMAAAASAPKAAQEKPQDMKAQAKPPSPEQAIFREEALARIRRAVEARAGFAERLVAFWSNHFCVSVAKGGIGRITAGAFEREAIRPHVLGKFSDMLLAVESHPAMLHYLDAARSVGPNSRAGTHGRQGLNENLGREIMELHTLGVGSGYTQADVTNFAKILTGWTYAGPHDGRGAPGTFLFRPGAHEPGRIPLLDKYYPEAGVAQGRMALLDLARRPETAHFIATKLATAFVADEPPPPLVARLAGVFRDTDGDLRALSVALVEADDSWGRAPAKMRTPYDFMIAAHRLIGHVPEEPGQVLGPLDTMGMGLWAPPGPNGFSTRAAAWAAPEGMKLRLDYCALVAGRLREPPNPSDLLDAMCGGAPSPETRLAVAHAESRRQGLALLLMSPEMQRS